MPKYVASLMPNVQSWLISLLHECSSELVQLILWSKRRLHIKLKGCVWLERLWLPFEVWVTMTNLLYLGRRVDVVIQAHSCLCMLKLCIKCSVVQFSCLFVPNVPDPIINFKGVVTNFWLLEYIIAGCLAHFFYFFSFTCLFPLFPFAVRRHFLCSLLFFARNNSENEEE